MEGLRLIQMIGKHIQVDWRGLYNFQSGRVTKKNKNGSFQVHYSDGDMDNIDLHNVSTKQSLVSAFGHKHKIYEWCIMQE